MMITVEEMRKILSEEFGINNDEDLEKALKSKGGIKIGIFTDKTKEKNDNAKMPAFA